MADDATCQLLLLPDELKLEVLSRLDFVGILSTASTCRAMRELEHATASRKHLYTPLGRHNEGRRTWPASYRFALRLHPDAAPDAAADITVPVTCTPDSCSAVVTDEPMEEAFRIDSTESWAGTPNGWRSDPSSMRVSLYVVHGDRRALLVRSFGGEDISDDLEGQGGGKQYFCQCRRNPDVFRVGCGSMNFGFEPRDIGDFQTGWTEMWAVMFIGKDGHELTLLDLQGALASPHLQWRMHGEEEEGEEEEEARRQKEARHLAST